MVTNVGPSEAGLEIICGFCLLQERDEQLITITENFQTAAATLQNLQSGLRAAKKERDSAHRQVEALARDLSALSVERDSLRSQLGQRCVLSMVLSNFLIGL